MEMEKICSKCGKLKEIVEKTTLCSFCVKERKKEYNFKFALKNREKDILRSREYYKNNKEKHLVSTKNWRKNNREIYLESTRKRRKKNRKENPHLFIWREILKSSLDRLDRKKEGKTIDLLGYSALELKEHLEKQFIDGMSWDNYGKWEIDHIKSICLFDKNTPMSEVNSLNNLQPLWKKDNLNKWFELKKKLKNDGV